jgi:hypothetical protein
MGVMGVFHLSPPVPNLRAAGLGRDKPAGQPLADVQAWRLGGHMPAVAIANPQVARFLSPETRLVCVHSGNHYQTKLYRLYNSTTLRLQAEF